MGGDGVDLAFLNSEDEASGDVGDVSLADVATWGWLRDGSWHFGGLLGFKEEVEIMDFAIPKFVRKVG
jgi:hypothetical protein